MIGWLWYYVIPVRRRVALDNVRRALGLSAPERRHIVRRCFEHQATMAVEALRMPRLTKERARALLTKEGWEPVWELLARGQGVILVASHLGNYDMTAACLGLTGEPLHAVVRQLGNPAVNAFVARNRQRAGYRTIPPRRSKEQIRATLAEPNLVALVVDQHMAAHRAIVCSFFGQYAATSPAPVRFALETGAPLYPLHMYRDPEKPGHHVARIGPRIELEMPHDTLADNLWHNTERINRMFEEWIRDRPEEWLWMHKRWKVHDNPAGWPIRREVVDLVEG
jgi:KDO2-lipid IV(A) lauroyltransferase